MLKTAFSLSETMTAELEIFTFFIFNESKRIIALRTDSKRAWNVLAKSFLDTFAEEQLKISCRDKFIF